MERRIALKNMAVAFGGLLSLPSWAQNWTTESVAASTAGHSFLSAADDALLAEIAETIIPETDIPGAKSLGVHTYIQKIVKDCMDTQAQDALENGLYTVGDISKKSKGKDFVAMNQAERTSFLNELLTQGADEETKTFYNLVKTLTIKGFTTSEYYLTNVAHYQLVPGFYHGCVPISTSK